MERSKPRMFRVVRQALRSLPSFRRFRADDGGAVTIEFVIWLPVFFFILLMTTDLSMLLMRHANIWDVARDVARRIAVYGMTDEEAEALVSERLGGSATVDLDDAEEDEVTVQIQMPIADAAPFGIFGAMSDTIGARITMLKEPI